MSHFHRSTEISNLFRNFLATSLKRLRYCTPAVKRDAETSKGLIRSKWIFRFFLGRACASPGTPFASRNSFGTGQFRAKELSSFAAFGFDAPPGEPGRWRCAVFAFVTPARRAGAAVGSAPPCRSNASHHSVWRPPRAMSKSIRTCAS